MLGGPLLLTMMLSLTLLLVQIGRVSDGAVVALHERVGGADIASFSLALVVGVGVDTVGLLGGFFLITTTTTTNNTCQEPLPALLLFDGHGYLFH